MYLAGRFGLPPVNEFLAVARPDAGRQRNRYGRAVAAVVDAVAYAIPGVLVGGLFGWFIIRPVNAVLGWFFGGFNRGFDRPDRALRPGRSAARCA